MGEKFPYRNKESIIEYGKSIGLPALNYYNEQFIRKNGDFYKLRKRWKACEIFDPLFLKGKENNIQRLNNIARDLKHFEYPDFDDEFLTNLEMEIPLAVKHANKEFDWNSNKETHNFKIRIEK